MKLNIRKRGQKWEYRFEISKVGGKRKQVSKGGFATKKECTIAGTEAMNQYNKTGKVFKPNEISCADFLDYWIENYVKVELQLNTLRQYQNMIERKIKPILGNIPVAKLSPRIIQDFINQIRKSESNSCTIRIIIKVLSSALSYAVFPMEYIDFNPCSVVKMPKLADTTRKHTIIYPDLFQTILDHIEQRERKVAMMLGYYAGLRVGEVLGLTWDNIDFTNKTVTVEKQIIKKYVDSKPKWLLGSPKTPTSNRTIKINDSLLSELNNLKTKQKQDEIEYGEHYTDYYVDNKNVIPVFRGQITDTAKNYLDFIVKSENGEKESLNNIHNVLRKISKKIGIKITFHDFRHSHATLLANNIGEQGLKSIQERLGHSSANTTLNIYMHSTSEMDERLVDIIDKKITGV